ncbi:hypothetical protein Sste5346_005138 [Sporothrix stenoceras]|uniref:Ubiquitin fusion degradation protein n=1 Tax=Sporothrix stenoceras TaxID=5173 RepID=A0ABR3Z5Y5_9PEZI
MATLHADSNDGADSLSNTNINISDAAPIYEPVYAPEEQALVEHYEFVHSTSTLLQLLINSLVLAHTAPYLSVHDVLRLAATSKDFRGLIYGTPSVFRYLDLSRLQSAIRIGDDFGAPIDRGGQTWRNEQIDENLTEDEFYSGPLRGAFRALTRPGVHTGLSTFAGTPRGTWLAGVHTLILNNVSVTAELVHEIMRSPDYNVRILSLRNAKHCNEVQLRHILRTACRASRPDGTPKLRGLYIFGGGRQGETGWDNALGGYGGSQRVLYGENVNGDDLWYHSRGRVLPRSMASVEWAGTLMDCRGVIAFDGVLCTSPRHTNSPAFGKVSGLQSHAHARQHTTFAMASFALDGCAGCGSAPDGWTTWGDPSLNQHAQRYDEGDPYLSRFPLLWPPPLLSSNVRVAMCPEGESPNPGRFGSHAHAHSHTHSDSTTPSQFIARCELCVHGRLCALCHRWWCESCIPDGQNGVPWTDVPSTATNASSSSTTSHSHKVRTKDGKCRNCRQ